MAINKVIYGNDTLIDLTSDTATSDKVLNGYTFHDASGTLRTGSASAGPTLPIDISSSSNVTGILNVANGGTGNDSGYVRAGQKASTTIGTKATAEGYNTTASGNYSHAEGTGTTASFLAGHAEGTNTSASGNSSHAEGYGAASSGTASHAEGYYTSASADYAHAEGDTTKAKKTASHAEGYNTTADGSYSHAEGYFATTSGYYAHVEGYFTTAKGSCSHVQGKYNIQDNNNTYAHIVGNGNTDNTRSNAHTLDWSGNAWFAGDVTDGTGNVLSNKQDKLPTVVNDRYLHTNASTGALEWAEGGGGGGLYPRIIVSTDTGSTVVITDGVVTITATETSTGIYSADIPDYGVYTVTANKGSESATATVNVNTVSEYTISLDYLPNGSTATPTNNIQTWLKCARINDKNYTTLKEVLDDADTFNVLLADSNACDYMARSTNWSMSAENLVPTMTSNTTPSGVVSSSSILDSSTPAYKAFNKNFTYGDLWASNGNTNQWIQYEFPEAKVVNKVILTQRWNGESAQSVQAFEILASNDGFSGDSHKLYSGTAQRNTNSYAIDQIFTFENDTAYKYYRFVAKTNYGNTGTIVIIELQLCGEVLGIVDRRDSMSLLGKYDYACKKLLGVSEWATAIANSAYYEYVLKPLIPAMTSNTTPSGEASSSSDYNSSYTAWHAFNGTNANASDTWASNNVNTWPKWIQYMFPEGKIVNKVKYYTRNSSTASEIQSPNEVILQGSNDGSNWTNLTTNISTVSASNNEVSFSFANGTAYKYYRLDIESANLTGGGYYVCIGEMQFYGRASLIDSYIPLVPTMTSNTTPIGVASARSEATGYNAFKAFDGNDTTYYTPSFQALSDYSDWLCYEFDSSEIINYVYCKFNIQTAQVGATKKYKIQGSNDGFVSDINDLYSNSFTMSASNTDIEVKMTINNNLNYKYYRLIIDTMYVNNAYNFGIKTLQFYGKLDKTIVHSTPYDTVYYKNNGSNIPLCTTNGDGIGEIDIASLSSGTYTLYSSVAKDPANLSNDYGKTIRISNSEYGHTTEIYIMPDAVKTLYWWGYIDDSRIEACTTANGWAANSYGATFNTNDIRLYSSSSSQITGIGTKNAINMSDYTKLTVINNGINTVAGGYGYCGCNATKVTNTDNIGSYTTAGVNKKEWDISSKTGNQYLSIANNANTRDLKILAIILE